MLVEFNFGNFLSFKDPNTLSMVGVKSFKEQEDTNIFRINDKLKLLKSAVVYGNNASGKSNLVKAFGFMRGFVLHSFRDALIEGDDKQVVLTKFLLNSESEKIPSTFEVVFFAKNIKYRYGFEIEEDRIVAEWLFQTTSKEVPLFTRENGKFYINKSSFSEGLKLDKKTKNNVLFLTYVAHNAGEIADTIITWFRRLNVISGIHDRAYKQYTIEKLKDDKAFQLWANSFIKFLEISKMTTTEKEISALDIKELKKQENDEELINLILQSKQSKRDQIITWHRKYDKNNLLVDTVPFIFDQRESEGTKKLIYLLGPWYHTLRNGRILIVDELDARLHTNLIKHLVNFFHYQNNSTAQLIFAVHDTSILSKDIFRRDQIWFIEKDQFGASDLYSLGDFKSEQVRKKSAFNKNYVQGKYGAIPYFEKNEKLMELLYGEEQI